jgi:hypothetical protein
MNDVRAYLKADATLTSLLGATAALSKIYPNEARQGIQTPYLIYNLAGEGTPEEILKEFSMTIKVVCERTAYDTIQTIEGRLDALLDLQDLIRNQISSSNYIFRWCKKASGTDLIDPKTGQFYRVIVYDFKVHEL